MLPIPSAKVSSDGGKWRNYKLLWKVPQYQANHGEYVLDSPILSIPMVSADVVLGLQWLQYLGTVAFNFQ